MRPQSLNQRRLTVAGFIGLYLHGIIVATPGAFYSKWMVAFDNEVNLGAFYSTFLVSSLVGLLLVSQRKKRHPFFALAFAIIGIAFVVASFSPNFGGISGAAFPIGFGDGILNFQCNNLLGELHPKRRIVLLNWANGTFGLGALSTPILSIFLPWRVAFGLVSALAIGSILLAWNAPSVWNYAPKQDKIPWKQASPFWLVILLYVGLESSLGTWSGTYLHSVGWSSTQSSAMLSIYWVGLTLGRLNLGTWINPKPIVRLRLLLLAGVGFLSLTLIPSCGLFFAGAAFVYGPVFATIFALLQVRCGHVALGYLFYGAYVGKTVTPALLEHIENPSYLPYGFLALALLLYLVSYQIPTHHKSV
ncbi:MAG: MFS transporter [Xenococcaceae cyanobacterium MO_207.B15]|nr:MFS transporter [Xenococcaceae cyanobacterium MO_207.B15]